MRYSRYVGNVDIKDIVTKLYSSNIDFKLLLDDIIYEEWEDIGFNNFMNIVREEALWDVLDTISDNDSVRKSIEDKLFFDEPESKDWEVCPAFASEKDFNDWWYGR